MCISTGDCIHAERPGAGPDRRRATRTVTRARPRNPRKTLRRVPDTHRDVVDRCRAPLTPRAPAVGADRGTSDARGVTRERSGKGERAGHAAGGARGACGSWLPPWST